MNTIHNFSVHYSLLVISRLKYRLCNIGLQYRLLFILLLLIISNNITNNRNIYFGTQTTQIAERLVLYYGLQQYCRPLVRQRRRWLTVLAFRRLGDIVDLRADVDDAAVSVLLRGGRLQLLQEQVTQQEGTWSNFFLWIFVVVNIFFVNFLCEYF